MSQEKISLRIVGTSVFTTINEKHYKGSFTNMEKIGLKKFVDNYNKKPSEFWLNKVIKVFDKKEISLEKIKAKLEKNKKKQTKDIRKIAIKKAKEQKAIADAVSSAAIATIPTELLSRIEDLEKKVNEMIEEKAKEIKKVVHEHEPKAATGHRRSGEN